MFVKHQNKIHHLVETPLGYAVGDEWKPEPPVPEGQMDNKFAPTFPKIPYALFQQVCRWQTAIALEHSCESTTSLFLIDGKWVAVPFFQENRKGAMTIDVDFTTPENQALMDHYADKSLMGMHATLHNHVNAGAGQSGTDAKDEQNLFGPHMTIGNLNMRQMTFHARMSVFIGGKHKFIELKFLDIIDVALPFDLDSLSATQIAEVEKMLLCFDRSNAPEYPEEWKDRFSVKAFTVAPRYTGHQPSLYFGHVDEIWEGGDVTLGGSLSDLSFVPVARHLDSVTSWPTQAAYHCFTEDYKKWQKWVDSKAPEIVREAIVALCLQSSVGLEELHKSMCEALKKKEKETTPK